MIAKISVLRGISHADTIHHSKDFKRHVGPLLTVGLPAVIGASDFKAAEAAVIHISMHQRAGQ